MTTKWNYDADIVFIAYESGAVPLKQLVESIEALGFKAETVDPSKTPMPKKREELAQAPTVHDAPKFYIDAFVRAKEANRLLVVDFWAPWCPPCIRLKKETLSNPGVANLLGDVEVVYVNLDDHPALGEAFGVTTVPDVFFIGADGSVVDRLKEFEDPTTFKKRLAALP